MPETKKYLDLPGLTAFWAKTKTYIDSKDQEVIAQKDTAAEVKTVDVIPVAGGPLANDSMKAKFPDGISADTDMQSLLMALFCKELYPTYSGKYDGDTVGKITNSNGSWSITVTAPTPSTSNSIANGALVEVGQIVKFNAVTANNHNVSATKPSVKNLTWGYATGIDAETGKPTGASTNTTIEASWASATKDSGTYGLSASKVGFTVGTTPDAKSNDAYGSCALNTAELFADFGTNTYKITETTPTFKSSHAGIDSKYVISNIGNVSEAQKTTAVAAVAEIKDDASNTQSFTVTGVYPIFANGVEMTDLSDAAGNSAPNLGAAVVLESGDANSDAKLALKNPNGSTTVTIAVSFAAHNNGVGYRLFIPKMSDRTWSIDSAYAIDPLSKAYTLECTSDFEKIVTEKDGVPVPFICNINNEEIEYDVYEWLATEGPNRVKFVIKSNK